jgi:PAS domain-containing protein
VVWSVSTGRTELASRYGAHDIGIFRLLSPHICRALTISDALEIRTLRSEMLEATLNGLAAGVYLTRRDGRVVYMNAAAELQVKAGNALRILNNRLIPTDPQTRTAIYRLEHTKWTLEIVDENGTSIVWDSEFETDVAAHAEFLRSVETEGLDVIWRDPTKLH